jgi:xanthine dehydrogenase accessory factor
MTTHFERLLELIESGTPCVAVTLVDHIGSIPSVSGSKMIVTARGLEHGTVGGGKVELRAIQEAQRLLSAELRQQTHFVQWNLNQDIGMTCGGSVKLYFETFNAGRWNIVIFGAGHVSNQLVRVLLPLDCSVTVIDPREEWLGKLPESAALTKRLSREMPREVETLPPDAFVLLMTMGHTTDKPILLEILSTREFPYVGVIGSEAKAVRLRQDVLDAGLGEEQQRKFFCPIGLPIGGNAPQEIAISVAAQLLAERDRIQSGKPRRLS